MLKKNSFLAKSITLCVLAVILLLPAGCATKPNVRRMDVDEDINLTGEWNASDSMKVADHLLEDCLKRSWADKFYSEHGRQPVVIVGLFRNKSSQHINEETFTNDIVRGLVNSGRVDFVAGSEQRAALRAERQEQAQHASEETMARFGEEIGADYMLQGSFHASIDQTMGEKVIDYRVDMELINLETNRKTWMGAKRLRKYVDRGSGYSW